MALFGAPIAHEDHAQRACYAALRLTASVGELAQELRREHGLDFQMRVGLNSGEVVVGKIGDDLRMDYTAQGETVGLAQRMEALAETGRPYLTQATAALAEGWFELADLGEFKVKGAPVPVRVFALDGVGSFRTRLDLSRARGFSRFVGRRDDLATLGAALEQALEGQGQVVGIVAEAGVGKSRLCLEFAERCRARGIAVREAQAVSHGRNIPLLPVLQLLRAIFGIDARDGEAEARQKIAGAVVLRGEGLQRDLPLLFEFMGVPDSKRPAPSLEPEQRQRRLDGLLHQLLQARSREEAGVYLVEDLHWIDQASEDFVERMVEAIPGSRTLVLVNFRPEYEVSWGGKSYYRQLPLLPLGPDAMRELLAHLLGSDPSLGDLADRIQQRTAGNPFFIEEMVQSLVDAGSLEGERAAYRLVTPVREIALPERVETLLAARIDRIDEREKRVLQTASVIGREFSRAVLGKVGELDAADLDEALRRLTAAEFVHERQIYPELEYAFKHPLTQEVAYHSLLGERRRASHAAVARAVEELEGERLDEVASLLAHHYDEAGDTFAAARWHARAAGSWTTNASRESFRHWQRVRELGSELPDSEETLRLRLLGIGGCLLLVARVGLDRATGAEQLAALVREGRELATRLGDSRAKADFLHGAAVAVATTLDLADAIPLALEAVADADAAGDVVFRLEVRGRIGVFLASASPRLALEAAEVTESLLEEARSAGIEVPGLVAALLNEGLGVALTQVGRFNEAGQSLERARQLAAQAGNELRLQMANSLLAQNESYRGDAARAVDYGRQAVDLAERVGTAGGLVLGHLFYGRALVMEGRFEEAQRVLVRGLNCADEGGVRLLRPGILDVLADALAGLGRAGEAVAMANEAIETSQMPAVAAQSHISRARALRLRDGLASALEIEADLAAAAALVEEHGVRGMALHIHEERARLAKLRGEEEGFRSELSRARDLAAELGASGHLERLERELASA
jgi:tetratricopeptide (TPR) repeat protein